MMQTTGDGGVCDNGIMDNLWVQPTNKQTYELEVLCKSVPP
jgi:hypothetical protein